MAQDRHVVSVVIPTLGRETLTQTLAALARQTRPPDEVLPMVDHDRRGVAWGRNQGLIRSKGDLIAFTDDDVVPGEDWLEQLVNAIDRYDAAVAGGTFQESDPLLDAIRRRKPLPMVEQVDDVGLVGNGGNILFRREWLDRCLREDGYVFNECFAGSGEDWELIWRFRKRGARMVYVPNHLLHLRRVTLKSFCRHSFHRGVGIARLYRIMNQDQGSVAPHESLLWGQGIQRTRPRWMRALWEKLFGPFERRLFRDARHFWSYWLGEKAQAVGFLWELAFGKPMSHRPTKTGRGS